ncbi:zinc finger, CCHC-type containing protein, partial [Tanacetum coccineum]
LRSEDPNQHHKDFLKLVDSLDLNGDNKERTRLRLFQFSLRDQASNWLERLPAGSISTWEDLTTRFLALFFPPRRNAKLRNDILIYQTRVKKSLSDFNSHQERRLSSLENQLGQQQDEVINKINILWKDISERFDDTSTAGNPTTQMNFASTDYSTKKELRSKGIKSPSKLLSPKYLSQSSLAEQNRNSSSPKRVHFINSIIILNKKDEAKEEGNVKPSATK